MLLRPVHPIHTDLAGLAGWKAVVIVMWLPIAAFLSLIFQPTFTIQALDVVVFLVAIWGAYFVRSMFQATIGMLNFWTTRGAAVFDLYMATEMLLCGRLVPLKLMPGWVQTLADFLPFKWTFGFPIESLVSDMSTRSLVLGLGAQIMWTAIGYVLFTFAWRAAIKRFSSGGRMNTLRVAWLYFKVGVDERAAVSRQLLRAAPAVADPGRDRARRRRTGCDMCHLMGDDYSSAGGLQGGERLGVNDNLVPLGPPAGIDHPLGDGSHLIELLVARTQQQVWRTPPWWTASRGPRERSSPSPTRP